MEGNPDITKARYDEYILPLYIIITQLSEGLKTVGRGLETGFVAMYSSPTESWKVTILLKFEKGQSLNASERHRAIYTSTLWI